PRRLQNLDWQGATGPSRTGVRHAAPDCFLNRRWLYQLSPPDWFVGLRHNPNDFVFRFKQRLECRHADFARADENDAHAELRRQRTNRAGATRAPPSHRLRQEFFARRNLAPAYRQSTAGTEIIENLPIGQD